MRIGSRNRGSHRYDAPLSFIIVLCCLLFLASKVPTAETEADQDCSTNTNHSPIVFVTGFVPQPTAHFSGRDRLAAIEITSSILVTPSRKEHDANALWSSSGDGDNPINDDSSVNNSSLRLITEDPKRSVIFSLLMTLCGASLGPFLDSYHSAFGVLAYNEPIRYTLWGSEAYPALTTAWWVPELFGLAGFLIGWLYILLDNLLLDSANDERRNPSSPKILAGISFFTLQYWLSGTLVQVYTLDRTGILNLMSLLAALGFLVLDGTFSGLLVSLATCLGGPLIEAGLITATSSGILSGGYHYTDLGETGFFPLWIVPVYFLGGPANGNLARGFWNALSNGNESSEDEGDREPCTVCGGTRRTTCPNCDGVGTYVAMGNRTVRCTSCNARGYVICRSCFDQYDEDPYDIEGIRETMNRMPD